MFCANCGSMSDDDVCRVCGTPALYADPFDTASPILAGWWSRVTATLIDALVLFVPTLILALLLGNVLGVLASVAAQAIYMISMQTKPDGQTLGNRAARTRVRDALTGQVITNGQGLVRWLVIAVYSVASTLSTAGTTPLLAISLLGLADCLYPLFNARKQTIHDRIARTIVVRV
ncbi:MAG TPA: RDD family protein [Acidimicrobiales bacterium]